MKNKKADDLFKGMPKEAADLWAEHKRVKRAKARARWKEDTSRPGDR